MERTARHNVPAAENGDAREGVAYVNRKHDDSRMVQKDGQNTNYEKSGGKVKIFFSFREVLHYRPRPP